MKIFDRLYLDLLVFLVKTFLMFFNRREIRLFLCGGEWDPDSCYYNLKEMEIYHIPQNNS